MDKKYWLIYCRKLYIEIATLMLNSYVYNRTGFIIEKEEQN